MELDVEKLENYFKDYNDQIIQVKGVGGDCKVNLSGLRSIVESIHHAIVIGPYFSKGNHFDRPTYKGRWGFCMNVVLNFLETGEVPDYNVQEVVAQAKNDLPFFVGKSFEAFSDKLRES